LVLPSLLNVVWRLGRTTLFFPATVIIACGCQTSKYASAIIGGCKCLLQLAPYSSGLL